MSANLLRVSRFIATSRTVLPTLSAQFQQRCRNFTTTRTMAAVVDSHFISQITQAEKLLTKQDSPIQGGPTARAQSHAGNEVTSQVVHDITMGERIITGLESPVQGGPTAIAQHLLAQASGAGLQGAEEHSGVLDSETISKITQKEKELTGGNRPIKQGPTAKAQQHAGEPINSDTLHDITEGEKKITGGDRVKGGPTATAQSELGKSRS